MKSYTIITVRVYAQGGARYPSLRPPLEPFSANSVAGTVPNDSAATVEPSSSSALTLATTVPSPILYRLQRNASPLSKNHPFRPLLVPCTRGRVRVKLFQSARSRDGGSTHDDGSRRAALPWSRANKTAFCCCPPSRFPPPAPLSNSVNGVTEGTAIKKITADRYE